MSEFSVYALADLGPALELLEALAEAAFTRDAFAVCCQRSGWDAGDEGRFVASGPLALEWGMQEPPFVDCAWVDLHVLEGGFVGEATPETRAAYEAAFEELARTLAGRWGAPHDEIVAPRPSVRFIYWRRGAAFLALVCGKDDFEDQVTCLYLEPWPSEGGIAGSGLFGYLIETE